MAGSRAPIWWPYQLFVAQFMFIQIPYYLCSCFFEVNLVLQNLTSNRLSPQMENSWGNLFVDSFWGKSSFAISHIVVYTLVNSSLSFSPSLRFQDISAPSSFSLRCGDGWRRFGSLRCTRAGWWWFNFKTDWMKHDKPNLNHRIYNYGILCLTMFWIWINMIQSNNMA